MKILRPSFNAGFALVVCTWCTSVMAQDAPKPDASASTASWGASSEETTSVGLYAEPAVALRTAAAPAEPLAAGLGSVQAGIGYSTLTGGNKDWRDGFVRGHVVLGEDQGVINWEVIGQNHFDETGQGMSISMTRNVSQNWFAMAGLGWGHGASFLPSQRFDAAVYRKWLAQRQLVTGLQFSRVKSGDKRYTDRIWAISASYYFDFPLVAEVGYKLNQSDPGAVLTRRHYVAATWGRDKEQLVSVRWDSGREGYQPIGFGGTLIDFKSTVWSAGWRRWLSRRAGFEVNYEHYNNPYYRRNSWTSSVFYGF